MHLAFLANVRRFWKRFVDKHSSLLLWSNIAKDKKDFNHAPQFYIYFQDEETL
jgi:hypothetical protein